ncbi:MAG: septum formation family protein [Bifidobacteriaceae bacterium]|jgi:hypothetical protein|nr:septum formation family protein [Bifidobacteriaceae bacterium]
MKTRHSAALLLVAALALSGCSLINSSPKRDSEGQVEKDTKASVTDLKLGDCTGPMADGEISEQTLVPCANEHYWEVYHTQTLPEGPFPADMNDIAEGTCYEALEPFLGAAYEESEYEFFLLTPLRESWTAGDRTISCLVGLEQGGVTGTLKGVDASSEEGETTES